MRTVFALLPLLLLITLVIVLLVYFVFYKRRINRILESKESTAHIPMASVESVGRVLGLIGAVLICISVFSNLSNIQNDLQMTNTQLTQQVSLLSQQISDLEYQLEQQESLITSFAYEVGTFDASSMTCDVTFTCAPKIYADDTVITLSVAGTEITLKKNGSGVFRATESFSIFEQFPENAVITITSGGISQTQAIDQLPWPSLCYECLPWLEVYSTESTFAYDHDAKQGRAEVTVENYTTADFSDITLIVKVNDEEVEACPITGQTMEVVFTASMETEDIMSLYVTAKDEYGLTHEMYLDGWSTDGYWSEIVYGKFGTLYDQNGAVLYEFTE